MNCTICGFQMQYVQLMDSYTCDKCLENIVEDNEAFDRTRRYYHDGDGVIREVKEGENT